MIHLNVEDSSKTAQAPGPGSGAPPKQPPTPPAAETPPTTGQPVFSKAYLEQEFPGFYSNPPSQPPQQPPSFQQQQGDGGLGSSGLQDNVAEDSAALAEQIEALREDFEAGRKPSKDQLNEIGE